MGGPMSQLSFFLRPSILLASCGLLILVGRAKPTTLTTTCLQSVGLLEAWWSGMILALNPVREQSVAVQQVGWWNHDACPQQCEQCGG